MDGEIQAMIPTINRRCNVSEVFIGRMFLKILLRKKKERRDADAAKNNVMTKKNKINNRTLWN